MLSGRVLPFSQYCDTLDSHSACDTPDFFLLNLLLSKLSLLAFLQLYISVQMFHLALVPVSLHFWNENEKCLWKFFKIIFNSKLLPSISAFLTNAIGMPFYLCRSIIQVTNILDHEQRAWFCISCIKQCCLLTLHTKDYSYS